MKIPPDTTGTLVSFQFPRSAKAAKSIQYTQRRWKVGPPGLQRDPSKFGKVVHVGVTASYSTLLLREDFVEITAHLILSHHYCIINTI
jgi:hypothetical protein